LTLNRAGRSASLGAVNPEPASRNTVRCGVAGVGSLGQHHARIYASLPGAELTGIFETNDARAAEICARHSCRRFATVEALVRPAMPCRSWCPPTGMRRWRFRCSTGLPPAD